VRVRGLVDRHAVNEGREVGAVVEVVAAQQILIRLAFAAMQGDDQPRDGFEHLAGTILRHLLQLLVGDHAFARGRGRTEQPQARRGHRDFL
jgi:hypothetical protein